MLHASCHARLDLLGRSSPVIIVLVDLSCVRWGSIGGAAVDLLARPTCERVAVHEFEEAAGKTSTVNLKAARLHKFDTARIPCNGGDVLIFDPRVVAALQHGCWIILFRCCGRYLYLVGASLWITFYSPRAEACHRFTVRRAIVVSQLA